jgi:hypothetical protein
MVGDGGSTNPTPVPTATSPYPERSFLQIVNLYPVKPDTDGYTPIVCQHFSSLKSVHISLRYRAGTDLIVPTGKQLALRYGFSLDGQTFLEEHANLPPIADGQVHSKELSFGYGCDYEPFPKSEFIIADFMGYRTGDWVAGAPTLMRVMVRARYKF